MDKEKFDKLNEESNREGSNSVKVAIALGLAVRHVLTPPDKKEPDLDVFSTVLAKGLGAMRAQIISEVLMKISDDGKVFSIPNNGEDFKTHVALFTALANSFADHTIMDFMKKAEEVSGGMIKSELVDKTDPRVGGAPAPSAPHGSTVH